MRVPNDPSEEPGAGLAELLRLQGQFQARLAEETISYLRRLQGASAPNAPGTVLVPEPDTLLEGLGAPGGTAQLRLEVENRQRVHCMVTPLLGQLVSTDGVIWTPTVHAAPPSQLVPPDSCAQLTLTIELPATLPSGAYRGALLLQGFREGGVPVAITVDGASPERTKAQA